MKFDYLQLAETIKNTRLKKDISTRKLAEKVGVSHAEISRFENGLKPNFYLIPFVRLCKELDIDLYNLLDDVGLYQVDYDRLYYVMFKSKNENIFKIHARSRKEAIRIAFDFVSENNLIELDETQDNVLIGAVENPKDFDKEIIKYFEETNQLLPKEDDEIEEEIEVPNECETCKYYCPYCGECTLGE